MSNKHINATFVKGATAAHDAPKDIKPHIAFIGRSNVGKSSFLNSLVGQKSLARSSSKPGKTTEINFFMINKKGYFVDLPGYGYAKQPKAVREAIIAMIDDYLFDELMPIKRIVMLVDAAVGPTEHDLRMFEELLHVYSTDDLLVIANKIDKIPKSKVRSVIDRIKETFRGTTTIGYSAKKHTGKDMVLRELRF